MITCNTPFTLQAVSPMVTRALGNVPVLGSPSDICRRPWDSVENYPFPCESCRRFKILEVPSSDLGTVSMCRRFRACAYGFLTMVTEGLIHIVHKVVIWLSFSVIQWHKVSQGIDRFAMC